MWSLFLPRLDGGDLYDDGGEVVVCLCILLLGKVQQLNICECLQDEDRVAWGPIL